MAYPRNIFRLVMSGTLFENETFSYGLTFAKEFTTGSAPSTVPTGIVDAVVAFHTGLDSGVSNAAKLKTIKFNEIGTDGRYVSASETVLEEFETPWAGGRGAAMPAQVALAITLRTAKRRGRARAGRFYIPYGGSSLTSLGRIQATDQENIAAAVTTFLNDLNTAAAGIGRLAVASDVGTGAIELITHCEVGGVLDTLRTRRKSLDEARVTGEPLAPPAP